MHPLYAEEAARVIKFHPCMTEKSQHNKIYIATPTIDCFRHAGNFSLGYHALS